MGISIDASGLLDAARFIQRNVGRPISDSLNRGALTFVIGAKGVEGAMQLTPKADKGAIRKLTDKELAPDVVAKLKKKGGKFTRKDIAEGIKKERNRRIRAAGYTAYAGWSNAAKAFGGRGVKGVTESKKKLARFGSGTKADPKRLAAELVNTAPAIELIGVPAAQKALDNAAGDLMDYGHRKIQELLNQVSA